MRYTLMRLASLVPSEIPVEIWDRNLEYLDPKLRARGQDGPVPGCFHDGAPSAEDTFWS